MQFPVTKLIFFLLLGIICESQARTPKLCSVVYDCSNEESPVWASTNGQFCKVFRNECLRLSENCDRINTNRPEAKKISKRKCQELCSTMVCVTSDKPVCGIYNGKKRTFENSCEMNRHICKTGKTYTIHHHRACSKRHNE